MIIRENILKTAQAANNLKQLPHIPHLTPDMCINIKRKQMVQNGDNYRINIEVTNRVINDDMIYISYKEITDHSTGESWISEFSGAVKSNAIRANILRYDDIAGNNTFNCRGKETYFLYANALIKFKYGSNQGDFFKMCDFTSEEFTKLRTVYKNPELTKDEAMEILVAKQSTPTQPAPSTETIATAIV